MKTKYYFSFVFASLFLVPSVAMAQDVNYQKEFDNFQKKQQKEYKDFKNKADEEFATFLKEAWQKYNASVGDSMPTRPEPVKPTLFDKKKPVPAPVEIKPAAPKIPVSDKPGGGDKVNVEVKKPDLPAVADKPAPGVYVPGKPYTPVKVDIPVPLPGSSARRNVIEFYGTQFEVATDIIEDFVLGGTSESKVAAAWSRLCKADHEQLINDCVRLKNEHRMNDWAFLLFIKQLGVQMCGAVRKDDVAFLQMFILNKCGYKVRLSKINDKLKLLVAPAGTIFGVPYITFKGVKYYVFEADKGGSMAVYTYSQDFANAKNLVCMDLNAVPQFGMQELGKTVSPSEKSLLQINAIVNKNLMDFYKDYPQCEVAVYYKTPMSKELKSALYPSLQTAIKGKSEKDAANILIDFVQNSFQYQTDGEQFGYEKPFFMDENFYYPACDCEDRAILFSNLVKDLMGLDAVLLDYPNHIASAVRFNEEISGDYILLDGKKYLICDPTYIGAPIGMCMDRFKSVAPEIIR